MAYTDVNTGAVADLFSAADFNKYFRDNFAAGVPGAFSSEGQLAVASAAKAITPLNVGNEGQVLSISGGLPAWVDKDFTLPCVKIRKTSPQTNIAKISWDTVDINTSDFTTTSTGIKTGSAGIYMILAHFEFTYPAEPIKVTMQTAEVGSWMNVRSTASHFDLVDIRYWWAGAEVMFFKWLDSMDNPTINKGEFAMIRIGGIAG